MKGLKFLILFLVLFSSGNNLIGQKGYYNAVLDFVDVEVPFNDEFIDELNKVIYKVRDAQIIEYYSPELNRFLGISIDQESIPTDKLKFIKKNKRLKKLIKKMGLRKTLLFMYDIIRPGMSTQEVYLILGKPYDFKYRIDKSSQLMTCYFFDSIYDSLEFRDNVLEKINYL